MKYLTSLTIGVCLLFASLPAMAAQAEDEAAIRNVVEQINAAFNRHDARGMAAHIMLVEKARPLPRLEWLGAWVMV